MKRKPKRVVAKQVPNHLYVNGSFKLIATIDMKLVPLSHKVNVKSSINNLHSICGVNNPLGLLQHPKRYPIQEYMIAIRKATIANRNKNIFEFKSSLDYVS